MTIDSKKSRRKKKKASKADESYPNPSASQAKKEPVDNKITAYLSKEDEKVSDSSHSSAKTQPDLDRTIRYTDKPDEKQVSPPTPPKLPKKVVEGKRTKQRRSRSASDVGRNRLLTDYFPVRRSDRRPRKDIEAEREQLIRDKILSQDESELKVVVYPEKGRGVVAARRFARGDFVVEYAGEHIGAGEAARRERLYAMDTSVGCYMYYFRHRDTTHCVDATRESGRLGRLVNHSAKQPNCQTRSLDVQGAPRLILVAARDIPAGEELLYDYGDRSRSSLESHPWLAS